MLFYLCFSISRQFSFHLFIHSFNIHSSKVYFVTKICKALCQEHPRLLLSLTIMSKGCVPTQVMNGKTKGEGGPRQVKDPQWLEAESRRTAVFPSENANTLVLQGCCTCRSPAWNSLLSEHTWLSLPSLLLREAAPDQPTWNVNL